jgi:hypothetical protein
MWGIGGAFGVYETAMKAWQTPTGGAMLNHDVSNKLDPP